MKSSRVVSRLAWALCGAILVATVAAALVDLRLEPTGSVLRTMTSLATSLGFAVFGVTGALIVTRQPRNTVGWLLLLEGALAFVWPLDSYFNSLVQLPAEPSAWFMVGLWSWGLLWLWLIFPILFIPLFFPTGRPPSPRWRWLIVLGLGLCAFFILFATTQREWTSLNDKWTLASPLGVHDLAFPMAPWAAMLLSFAALSVGSLLVRYRRASAVERGQVKWLLYAAGMSFLIYAGAFVFSDLTGDIGDLYGLVLNLGILTFPVAITVAILRYKLYDIDVVIRKTLVYTAVTVLLALVYFGGVVLLQGLFGALTGVAQSPLAVVISTLAIAALFTPLRRRIQDGVDRRFYRRKYDAQQVLARFAQTARDETDLDALTGELTRVVQETLQPEHVSMAIREVTR
jgi:hypothetical protein